MNKLLQFSSYKNIYGQTVKTEVLEYVSCYELFDEPSEDTPEVYSNIFCVPKNISDSDFLSSRYDYHINDEDQIKKDEIDELKRKVILNTDLKNIR